MSGGLAIALSRAAVACGILGGDDMPSFLGLEDGEWEPLLERARAGQPTPLAYAEIIHQRTIEALAANPGVMVAACSWSVVPAGDPVSVFRWFRKQAQRRGQSDARATVYGLEWALAWMEWHRPETDTPEALLRAFLVGERLDEAEAMCLLEDAAERGISLSRRKAEILHGIAAKLKEGGRLSTWERDTALAWVRC